MMSARRLLHAWLPVAFAISVLAFTGLFVTHQQLRAAADEPQDALVVDAAHAIDAGGSADAWLPPPIVLETGEGLFLARYDRAGVPLWSNARLRGALPAPPPGIFSHADGGEHRLSWMPAPGVREALVIVRLAGGRGYLVAARSLHAAEARKRQATVAWLAGWMAALLGSLLLAAALLPHR
jgi:hypothetical protein